MTETTITNDVPSGTEQLSEARVQELVDKAEGKAPEKAEEAPKLLAGKYKTTEELEKAYKELESKQGARQNEKAAEAPKEQDPAANVEGLEIPAEAVKQVADAGLDLDGLAKEYAENNGLTQETYAKLASQGLTQDIVDRFIEGEKARAREYSATIKSAVGGEDDYAKLSAWAAKNMTEAEKSAYNAAVSSGDVEQARLAVLGLKQRMTAAVGQDPDLVEGTPSSDNDGFKSDAELIAALRDPRFKKDPAYQEEVKRRAASLI